MRFPRKRFLAVLLFAVPLAAQVVSTSPTPMPALSQTLTTAMVGFTGSQTAQLSVLNMNPATTTTLAGCEVQLAFYDSQNKLLKQGAATSVAPGTATTLFLSRSEIPVAAASMPRVSIRGQAKTILPPTTTSGPAVLSSCALLASLEIYDNVTGVTQLFTSDTRTVFTGDVIPVTAGQIAPR
jgi:hypothetical protein